MKCKCLLNQLNFPEGPCFDSSGRLWCTELKTGNLVCYDNGHIDRYNVGINVNGAAFDKADNIWFTDSEKGQVCLFKTQSKKIEVICDNIQGEPLKRPNDLAFDPKGNLIVSCHGDGRTSPEGYLICIDLNNNAQYITRDKFFTNGIAFSSDGSYFIYSETYKQRLWKAEWDSDNCSILKEEPWAHTEGPIGPDGIAFDTDGFLYVSVFGQGSIAIFDQNGGQKQSSISIPAQRPTSCSFDPLNRYGLVVSEAETGQLLSIETKKTGISLFKRTYDGKVI